MTGIVIEPYEATGSIYGLHSGDGLIRYVGQTTRGVRQRMNEHVAHSRTKGDRGTQQVLAAWIVTLETLHVRVLETGVPVARLTEREMHWTAAFPACDLLNVPPEVQYRGRPHTAESRAKIGRRGSEHWAFGRPSPKRVFTDAEVVDIRSRVERGETRKAIAEEYGVHRDTVERFTRRRSFGATA